jgi:hypothetical protein
MEPMTDRELDDLLAGWRAPSAPPSLQRRIMQYQRNTWLMWLFKGHLQIPVPALALTICAVVFLVALVARAPTANESRMARSEGLQPVKHLKVRIIRSNYEASN